MHSRGSARVFDGAVAGRVPPSDDGSSLKHLLSVHCSVFGAVAVLNVWQG